MIEQEQSKPKRRTHPPAPPRRKGPRAVLSMTEGELRVLGFLFAMVGTSYEAIFQRAERLGWLAFWASLMGLSTVWKGKGQEG